MAVRPRGRKSRRVPKRRRLAGVRRDLVEVPIMAMWEPRQAAARVASTGRVPKAVVEIMQEVLLDEFAPASVLINSRYEILSMQGPLVDYLQFPPGEPTRDLLSKARPGLRTKIRSTCQAASSERRAIVDSDARVKRNGRYVACSVTVRPLTDQGEANALLLVTFHDHDAGAPAGVAPASPDAAPAAQESRLVQNLEYELKTARGELQGTIEELESSNEELKASNEEVMSMNEELQSANEELTTVNSQLQDKVDELDKANNDIMNLLTSTDIATVFLDTDLRIKRFTPPTRKLLNLVTTAIGRSLADFAPKLSDAALLRDCRRVADTRTPVEAEITNDDKRTYLRRILPYRTADNRIEGVVITFIDITERKRAAVAVDAARYTRMVEQLPAGAVYIRDGQLVMNRTAEDLTGYSRDELTTVDAWFETLYGEQAPVIRRLYERKRNDGFRERSATVSIRRKDGTERFVEFAAYRFEDGEVWLVDDVTDRYRANEALRESEEALRSYLARTLHDDLGGLLTGISLLSQSLGSQLSKEGSPSSGRVAELIGGINELHTRLRAAASGLMPVESLPEGLMEALSHLAEEAAKNYRKTCRFVCEPPVYFENASVSTQLFRIAQEAVINATRHSEAGEITITLKRDEDGVHLAVIDDGLGMATSPAGQRGLGLQTMRQRARLLSGELKIEPNSPRGTVVACHVPLSRVR